ncbi:MAG: restriction endonuclease subunit S [Patescibacteria group bacterium]
MLRDNWQTKKLGEVLKLEYGKPLSKDERNNNGKYPVYGANGIKNYSNKYFYNRPSIIVGRKGSAGEINLTKEKFWPLDVTYFVTFDDKKYDLKFLYNLLETLELQKLAKGVKPGINRNNVYSIKVNIPSLPEQHRIIKILDKVFGEIGKAKENTEKNLQNTKDLFESYLQNVFKKPGEDWKEKRLRDVYDVRDGTHDSPKYHNQGYALITSKNLKKDELDYKKIRYVSEKDYLRINERSKVHKGDILFAMIGTIGNPVVVKNDPNFAIKNVALFKIPKEQDSYFLKYFLDSKFVIDKMTSEAKGTTQKFVGLGYLRDFKIKLPILSEQKSIVKKLDELNEKTKRLEEIYKQKLSNLEELKKSILKKAFEGNL